MRGLSWLPLLLFLSLLALAGLLLAIFINTMVWMAKPVEGVGIAMPGLFPALLATLSALLLVPDHASAVAFVAGVLGPLIGADLLCTILKNSPPASPASAAPAPSMASYSPASWRRIWRE